MSASEMQQLRARLEAALPAGAVQELLDDGSLVLAAEHLLAASRYLHDQEGLDYLSNLSGVDWLEEERMEVVYHLYAIRRGEERLLTGQADGPLGPIVLRVRLPRTDPEVPSVTGVWLSALFQEREVYDMFGIRFAGHPDLRRIYLWDEFADYPLRKDYVQEEV